MNQALHVFKRTLMIPCHSFLIELHTLTNLFLSVEAQLQQLGVRRQQFFNKGRRQLCVDLVYYLKADEESTITSKISKKSVTE